MLNKEIKETQSASIASQLWNLPDQFIYKYLEAPSRGWKEPAAPLVLFETTALDEYSLLYQNGDFTSLVKAAMAGKAAFITKGSPAKGDEASRAVMRQAFAFLKAASLLLSCCKTADCEDPENLEFNVVKNMRSDCSMLQLAEELLSNASRNSHFDTIVDKYQQMKQGELTGAPKARWSDLSVAASLLVVDPPGSLPLLNWSNSKSLNSAACRKGAKGDYKRGIARDILDDEVEHFYASPAPPAAMIQEGKSSKEDEPLVTLVRKTAPPAAMLQESESSEEGGSMLTLLRKRLHSRKILHVKALLEKSTDPETMKPPTDSSTNKDRKIPKGVDPFDEASISAVIPPLAPTTETEGLALPTLLSAKKRKGSGLEAATGESAPTRPKTRVSKAGGGMATNGPKPKKKDQADKKASKSTRKIKK